MGLPPVLVRAFNQTRVAHRSPVRAVWGFSRQWLFGNPTPVPPNGKLKPPKAVMVDRARLRPLALPLLFFAIEDQAPRGPPGPPSGLQAAAPATPESSRASPAPRFDSLRVTPRASAGGPRTLGPSPDPRQQRVNFAPARIRLARFALSSKCRGRARWVLGRWDRCPTPRRGGGPASPKRSTGCGGIGHGTHWEWHARLECLRGLQQVPPPGHDGDASGALNARRRYRVSGGSTGRPRQSARV